MNNLLPLERLIDKFQSLPSIGRKSATRLAYHILDISDKEANDFANAIIEAKKCIGGCPVCQNLSCGGICPICSDDAREKVICVVEDSRAVNAIESTREYHGTYHVLHGVISPIDGVGPEQLRIKELLSRLDGINEIIIATNPSVEGEATAMYLSKLIKPFGIKITRLAYGIPVGASLEYTDSITLMRAIEGRREM
ncbi:MAG: recombination protein RecR [Clostridiales bacterium GWF2_38_85]|nr:MAG: recombination protein RecR [Clostridiales bacterium GWF2_38_85]HBL83602.1 recombination protein RecR [Clostridiales bacterium]